MPFVNLFNVVQSHSTSVLVICTTCIAHLCVFDTKLCALVNKVWYHTLHNWKN